MSGWIKVEKSLDDDPRVIRMVARLRNADVTLGSRAPLLVIGALVKFWWYADTHIRQDDTLDLSPSEIDEMVGLPGFCDLLPECWLRQVDGNCVELPDFQKHNGVEAKKRAVTQKRVSRHRNAASVTPALPDQTRPDHKIDVELDSTPVVETNGKHAAAVPGDVEQVFEHWQEVWGKRKAQLDEKRRKVIKVALKSYPVDDLRKSISGYRNSPHHRGENDRKTPYDSIELFLRDAQHIDAGMAFADKNSGGLFRGAI
jgi:hypothetical protein